MNVIVPSIFHLVLIWKIFKTCSDIKRYFLPLFTLYSFGYFQCEVSRLDQNRNTAPNFLVRRYLFACFGKQGDKRALANSSVSRWSDSLLYEGHTVNEAKLT